MPRRTSRRPRVDSRQFLRVNRLEDRITPALLYALNSSGNGLVSFDSASPGVLNPLVIVSGLNAGESIRGIDFRPATGQLYAAAASGAIARVGTINVATGAFTAVGSPFSVSAAAVDYGFDFNPTNDRIRLTNDADQNLLINPIDGAVTVQSTLNPGDPTIVGSAYSNNFPTAVTTTLFDIDSASDQLFTQNPPASGTLQLVGNLGVNTESSLGFDIAGNGIAFASFTVASATRLYTINLATGAATDAGQIGASPVVYSDIAVARFVWDGSSVVDSNWTTAANWAGDIAPQASDDLIFPAGAARLTNTNDFPDNTVFNSLTFSGSNYVVSEAANDANTIQLGSGILTNVNTGSLTFNPGLTLLNPQTWRNDGAVTAVINGNVNLNGNLLTVNANNGNITFSGPGSVIGAGGLAKIGSQVLTLQGSNNSYTGQTTISAGTVEVRVTTSLGAAGTGNETIVAAGATLLVANPVLNDEAILISGDGVGGAGAIVGDLGGGTVAGAVTLVGSASVGATSGNTLTLSGSIGQNGPANLTKVGAGIVTLGGSGSNTYSGVTTVNAGVLVLSKINTLPVNAIPGPLVINNGGIVSEAASDQIADSASVNVSGGRFELNGNSDTVLGISAIDGIVLTNGGRLVAGNAAFDNNSTLGLRLVGTNDSDRITVNGPVAVGGTLQLTSAGPVAVGTTITLIDNDGTDAIIGTFANAAQGSSFNVGGSRYQITYFGGTGNDVVLTALQSVTTHPTVTINQAASQADPTGTSPIVFSVAFNVTVTGFTASDVSLAGSTAGGTLVAAVSGSGANYTVSVSGMTGNGIVQATIPAGAASDGAGNFSLASTSTDNTVNFATTLPPAVVNLVAVGAGASGGPHVKVYNSDGSLRFSFFAYDAAFSGGVRVATGDVTGDGVDDIITGAGPNGGPHVKVFDGVNLNLVYSFFPYAANFAGGVFVAVGDVNNDGRADIITGAGEGGGPHVEVFSGQNLSLLNSYFPFGAGFAGGVRVAAADLNGDNRADVIAGSGPGRSLVTATDMTNGNVLASFTPYGTFTGGVYVAAGDINGDGRNDIITGAGEGGGSHVEVFSGQNLALLASYFAYPGSTGGVRVAVADVNGDGRPDIITGAGPANTPQVKEFNSPTLAESNSFLAFDPSFLGGIYVG